MPCNARGVRDGYSPAGSSSPWTRTIGGDPAVRCRSEPPFSRSAPSSSGTGIWTSSSCWITELISLHHPRDFLDRRDTCSNLGQTVLTQGLHPLLDGDIPDGIGRCALHREPFDLFASEHHFVETDPAPISGAGACFAIVLGDPEVGRSVDLPDLRPQVLREAGQSQLSLLGTIGLLALLTQDPGEALSDHRVDGRGDEERLDVHLDETADRRRGVVRV